MSESHKQENPWAMVNDIAEEIGRRGCPAEAKLIIVKSTMGNVHKCAVVVPRRGLAVINDDLDVVVASSNKPLPQALVFEYKNAEAAAENILRNLPLP